MNPPRPLKRVSRACDYCRKKRLKCTGQRPCMNCQLYGATCSTSDPKPPDNSCGPSVGDKRKQDAAEIDQVDPSERDGQEPAQSSNNVEQLFHPWNQSSEPEIAGLVQPSEIVPEFDQYAHELGLVLAPFWPAQSPLSLPLNHGLDAAADETLSSIGSYPAHLPTPRMSDAGPSGSVFQSLDLGHTITGGPFASASHPQTMDIPPSRSAHELFLRKGPSDTKFIGMGSVGSTISECLRYSVSTHGRSMESTILAHLVNGIRHVDELSLSAAFQNPPLPEIDFAERGVQAYYSFLHLLYPIIEAEFLLDGWRELYNESSSPISPVAHCRFCLVVLVGNIVSPSPLNSDKWETAQRLHEKTWSLLDRVMASSYMESLQVMLLHTVFLLYCGKTGIAWMTCGMAVHIAQSLGLQQPSAPQLGLDAKHVDLRLKLWSVAYSLDAFLSLSEGRPSAVTGSPSLASHRLSEQGFPAVDSKFAAVYIHDWHTSLAGIAHRVVTLLKNGESLFGTLAHISDLDAELLAWKDCIPMELRPDQQILADDPLYSLVAMLHLKYHNLMRTIHWVSLTLSTEVIGGDVSRLGARVRSSESICVTSARSIIEVLNGTEHRRIAGSPGGFIVPYCMAAISIFYRHILKEPKRHSARADLEHMRNGTLHITKLLDGIGSRSHFRELFKEMLRMAEEIVLKATDQGVSN
ncbi:hypothetical protein BDW59DRAFT_161076 [Aspergillus cavernicola]|uniref:Zn(2)-C6 fungal-type domain-containing protein n=1 Tax=Aspergillus cavernicola TaxID=176166 RepID=A0ABR4IEU1_9EURO